jgi:hypothetical protein
MAKRAIGPRWTNKVMGPNYTEPVFSTSRRQPLISSTIEFQKANLPDNHQLVVPNIYNST